MASSSGPNCHQMHPAGAMRHLSPFSTPGQPGQLPVPEVQGRLRQPHPNGRSLHHPYDTLSPELTCTLRQWPSLGGHSTSLSALPSSHQRRECSLQPGPAHPAPSLRLHYILDQPPCQRCYQSANSARDTGPTLAKPAKSGDAQAQKKRGSALPRVPICDVAAAETTFPTIQCE